MFFYTGIETLDIFFKWWYFCARWIFFHLTCPISHIGTTLSDVSWLKP